ncbi:AAA family ATPase [Akkermansia muciniphila]|uniref:AAA family ATPase n=1 Tax=Akkermansia muciniphila TaxID=239935 RepID=UPI000C9CF618|nr:ATP-binding protein [Akkermansia muciniphila]PNC05707.1 chromosome segregation protein SMC [Akkermansia muciniphila]
MLTVFEINNFKSLQNFSIRFSSKLTVLIGLNGAGKSTVLQGLDFLANLAQIEGISKFLDLRGWEKNELYTKFLGKPWSPLISYSLLFDVGEEYYKWSGAYNGNIGKCTKEEIKWVDRKEDQEKLMELKEGILHDSDLIWPKDVDFRKIGYRGSIISLFSEQDPYSLVWNEVSNILSIDLLSPEQMRRRSRLMPKRGVGLGGEQLSIFLHRLTNEQKVQIAEVMENFYPHFMSFQTQSMRGGGIKLKVIEHYESDTFISTESRHLNDGMLRVLAIIAETLFTKGTVLIDEIEDGINPDLLEKLVSYLLNDCPCQVILTTHSPLLLNFLPDDDAEKIVQFIYKDGLGITKSVPFFSIPKVGDLLGMLGAGEAMLQFNMDEVAEMAEQVNDMEK